MFHILFDSGINLHLDLRERRRKFHAKKTLQEQNSTTFSRTLTCLSMYEASAELKEIKSNSHGVYLKEIIYSRYFPILLGGDINRLILAFITLTFNLLLHFQCFFM